ncbi:hypothetical protein F5B20DRAFT_576351 [Whalleya microplaca]|nr:hypothetical protein F5B20DRAFT_576351 [Whalleya microplaca]
MSLTEPSGSGSANRDAYHAAEDKGRALLEQFKSHGDTRTRTSLQQSQLEDIYELNGDKFCLKGMKRALENLNTAVLAAWNVDINRLSYVKVFSRRKLMDGNHVALLQADAN